MTRQSSFKHRVRARMQKTGERYTAARQRLIEAGETPPTAPNPVEPRVSADAVRAATGRTWDEWFALMDEWGATDHTHTEMAHWLMDAHAVPGWWAQSVAVYYEQSRGLRSPGQRPDGWEVSASKTAHVSIERLYEAFTDDAERDPDLRLRTATAPRSARYDWEDGSTRVVVGFAAIGEGKSRLSLAHQKLPDADTAEAMKGYWRERVQALKEKVEA